MQQGGSFTRFIANNQPKVLKNEPLFLVESHLELFKDLKKSDVSHQFASITATHHFVSNNQGTVNRFNLCLVLATEQIERHATVKLKKIENTRKVQVKLDIANVKLLKHGIPNRSSTFQLKLQYQTYEVLFFFFFQAYFSLSVRWWSRLDF